MIRYFLFCFYFSFSGLLFGQELPRIDSLENILVNAEEDSTKVKVAIELSREIHQWKHDEEKEYMYARMASEISEELQDSLLYATALDNLGLLYRFHQHYAKAIPLHTKAYELVENAPVKPYFKMRFANNAGVAARYDQSYTKAVEYYLKALNIAENEMDLKNIAIATNGLGNTLSYIPGKEEEAMFYFQKALKAEEERDNSLGMAINYLSISDYYNRKEHFDTARIYLEKLLEINQEREDEFGLAMTYEFYGHNYYKEGEDLAQAKHYYLQALDLFEKIDNHNKYADVLQSMGDLYDYQGKMNQAKEFYHHSLEIAQGLNQKQLILDNAFRLSKAYEANSDFPNALRYFKLSQVYKDSINLSEQETQISAMKLEYDFQKKEAEIALLKKDKNLKEAELNTQREKLIRQKSSLLFSIGGLLSVGIFFLLILRNLNIKKNSKLLLKEQEKKRIQAEYEKNLLQAEILASRMQMNPHFLFNCLNSIKYLIQTEKFREAINYLTIFSRFIRIILETGQKKNISLSEELSLIKKYVSLEENRFDQNFTFRINSIDLGAEEMDTIFIPPLLLQPFVENAIWHGLLPSKEKKKSLEITLQMKSKNILITIEDNGVGRKNGKPVSAVDLHKSMGTRITQDRIDLFNLNSPYRITFQTLDLLDKDQKPLGTKVMVTLKAVNKDAPQLEKLQAS